jgi:hypothetical protein
MNTEFRFSQDKIEEVCTKMCLLETDDASWLWKKWPFCHQPIVPLIYVKLK